MSLICLGEEQVQVGFCAGPVDKRVRVAEGNMQTFQKGTGEI